MAWWSAYRLIARVRSDTSINTNNYAVKGENGPQETNLKSKLEEFILGACVRLTINLAQPKKEII